MFCLKYLCFFVYIEFTKDLPSFKVTLNCEAETLYFKVFVFCRFVVEDPISLFVHPQLKKKLNIRDYLITFKEIRFLGLKMLCLRL